MNFETSIEHRPEEIDHQRCHEIASHYTTEDDHRPVITCECAAWGEPCPHFFWAHTDAPEIV